MPVLAWRNDADGFAFSNSWTFDATERAALNALVQPAIPAAVAAVAALAPDPILITAVAAAAHTYAALGPLPTYGMCGGMAYASLDCWHAKAPLPRGAHAGDQPSRSDPASTTIRNTIWLRLIDSLGGGGVLQRTLEWSLVLNQVPAWLGGGAGSLLARTKQEWVKLRSHIDGGLPWPIGLVYTNRGLWDQHQILAYGYEVTGSDTVTLFVYDNNAPHQYGETGHNEVTLDFTGGSLVAKTPSDGTDTLAGFFCSNYRPVTPPAGLAKSFGQFLAWSGDSRTWMVTDGARMPLAGTAELSALGGTPASVRLAGASAPPKRTVRPRDGALLRERSAAPVLLYQGGSPFWIPDPTWLERFGGWNAVRVVPDGTIGAFAGPPDNGTLLREWSDPTVYRIMAGVRRGVATPADLATYGGFGSVRVVPDGALASIPFPPDQFKPPVFAKGSPGDGIGGYDLADAADRAFAVDYDGSGKLDHLVLYRPGTGTIWFLKNTGGTFSAIGPSTGAPGNGIGSYDLADPTDRAFAFDYNGSGKLDHLVLYRPGTGTIWFLKNTGGTFSAIGPSTGAPGNGIGGYDLADPADRAFAFDYNSSGKLDHLVLYRPGLGTLWILRNSGGTFSSVYAEGSPGHGIAGYDLADPADRAFAFDYNSSGKLDHLVLYRPALGTLWILRNNGGTFSSVYAEGSPGHGIGGYDLADPADRAFAFDYDSSGKLDHLVLYRPGTGTIWILKHTGGNTFAPVFKGSPGDGIGGYDLADPADRAFAFDYNGSGKLDHLVLYRPGLGTIWMMKKH